MKNLTSRKIIFVYIVTLLLLAPVGVTLIIASSKKSIAVPQTILATPTPTSVPTSTPTPEPTATPTPIPLKPASDNQYFFANINKTYALPSSFAPNDLVKINPAYAGTTQFMRKEAAAAFEKMAASASGSGVFLKGISGYRSFDTQNQVFNSYVKSEEAKGLSHSSAITAANAYSAMPGHSEHQLGNTMDCLSKYDNGFDYTATNKKVWNWIMENAHKYGFVVSYPEGKSSLTGYNAEPWHVRYVGIDLAQKMKAENYFSRGNNITLQSELAKISSTDGLIKSN